jgi:hypothetical protein
VVHYSGAVSAGTGPGSMSGNALISAKMQAGRTEQYLALLAGSDRSTMQAWPRVLMS